MTLYDFNALDEKSKSEAVFSTGTFVDDREEPPFKIQLYRLDHFYVEVYYDPLQNRVNQYRAFRALGQLAPYIRMT